MTIRFYILPIERSLSGTSRGPKYFAWSKDPDPPGINCPESLIDYGSIDECIIVADISDIDHASLSLNLDVYSFPLDLDTTLTVANRNTINTFFEAVGIPADWVHQGDTFRSVLRTVTQMFIYLQRVLGLIGYPTNPYAGLTLNTQYQNIPNPLHDALQTAAISLGYTWNVANNDQIRKIWKQFADAWGNTPINMGLGVIL